MELGIIAPVNPRELWENEERDFTPWLAENIDYLSEVIGVSIEIDEIEKRVGNYELDIYGKIEGSDKKVVIENQLEVSDHKHLGQLITYASGLSASVIIWITPQVNEEHKNAINWLNEISSEETDFFLIKPEVFQIDNSKPAVRFQIEAGPNDFERTIKSIVNGKNKPRHGLRRVFWSELIKYLSERNHSWAKGRRVSSDSWLSFSVGDSNYQCTVSMAMKQRLRVEIAFNSGDMVKNKNNYKQFEKYRDDIDQLFDTQVEWELLENKIMSRIAVYRPYSKENLNKDLDYNNELYCWIEENLVKMREVIRKYK